MKPTHEISPNLVRSEGLSSRTPDGLHEEALAVLTQHLTRPSKVLDLGAGTGLWAERLLALGHKITCVELDVDGFALKSVPCFYADLNEDFSMTLEGSYTAITAIEVIEHLENPRHFLRQCHELLDEGGILFMTTPNIECVASRLRFLRSGHFRTFDRDAKVNDPTHITPIQTFMFEKVIRDTGYKLLAHQTNNVEPRITNPMARIICKLVAPFVAGFKGGDHHVYVLTKPHERSGMVHS